MKEPRIEIQDQIFKDITYGAPFLGKFCRAFGINAESPNEIGLKVEFLPYWDV